MTISNRITLILVAGFAVLAVASGMSPTTAVWHVAAGAAVLVVAFGFFVRGWIGGGDAKLAAATALWLGFDHLAPYLLYASLFGGALTLALLQFRAWPLPALLTRHEWIQRLHHKDSGIPYGIALAAAAMVIYPSTPWMTAAGA